MERTRWTDDVLDGRMKSIDEKFDRLFGELHELRLEMRAGFSELRGEIVALHRQTTVIASGFAVGLLGLLGAVVATQF
jgi:hypothetical protein